MIDIRNKPFLWGAIAFGIVFFSIVACKSLFSDPIGPDAIRHLMTGVFYRDLLFSLPIENLRDFAYQYYAHYPSLGVLHWPPVFHLMEGICFTIFGVHEEISRLLIWALTLLGGVYSGRITKFFGGSDFGAFVSLIMYCSFPIVFQFSQQIMLEVPAASISVVSIFYFLVYQQTNRSRFVYLSAFVALIALLTKGTTIYLIPLIGLLSLCSPKLRTLKDYHLYIAIACFALAMGCYNYVVSRFNGVRAMELFGYYDLEYIGLYLSFVWKNVGVIGFLCWLIATGVAFRLKKISLAVFLFFGVFIVVMMAIRVSFPLPRYYVNQAVFMAVGVGILPSLCSKKYAKYLNGGIALISVFYIGSMILGKIPTNNGYDQVASYLINNKRGSSVFVDTRHPGNLAYHLRKKSEAPGYFLLPANKYLTYESPDEVVRVLYDKPAEIERLLEDYGVKYIIHESFEKNVQRRSLHKKLSEMFLNEEKFQFVKRFELTDSFEGDSELFLYEMRGDGVPKASHFDLKMGRLSVGSIKIPIESSIEIDH